MDWRQQPVKQRQWTGDEEVAIVMEGLKEKRSVAEIGHWIEVGYNKLYVHPGLEYSSPEEFEEFYLNQIPLKEAA